jgi:DNA-directed RNA polymerase specialized sigma24 family protein
MMRAEDREILHEACCDSRSHAEIAASHGISLEAARVRRHRALKRLLEIAESLEGGNVGSGKETPA